MSGITEGGDVDEVSGDDSDDARDDADSEFELDFGDEPPTVMFLTVSPLTVKLYSI